MTEQDHHYLKRIFALLDCFSSDKPELGVREAARMLHISSSSCGRMLQALREEGVITQNPETRNYSLAGRVMRWAEVYTESSDLRQKSYPYMQEIFRMTDETVSLYTAGMFDRVCIERIESKQTVRIVETIGTQIPIFTGSGGKAILAFRSSQEIQETLDYARNLPEYRNDHSFFEQLLAELREIREQGYAISHGEWQNDASGIASPILDAKGEPIGSISISGPTQRFLDSKKLTSYAALLLKNVGMISWELGYSQNFNERQVIA